MLVVVIDGMFVGDVCFLVWFDILVVVEGKVKCVLGLVGGGG